MTSHAHDAVMTALHDERLRVARNIHDLVMQDLTAVLLQLRAATSSSCNDSLSTCLGQATSAAEQGLQAARKLLRELRHEKPLQPAPDCMALAPLLHEAASQVPRSSDAAVLCEFGGGVELPPAVCDEVALVLREALSNALRHAQAREIVCQLLPQHHTLELRVSDDGRGFLPGACCESFGLRGMSERASLLGGALAVHSVPGSGTMVRLCLPLAP
jgi:signal transduction histidine kinase